ncbi:MAG: MFS transporter [Clostridiales Family XIII bacterium]|jgi:Na+/melibiose symporter-like transporter|nr:MFS transporter [Clostridiales Family XIII bacterium]
MKKLTLLKYSIASNGDSTMYSYVTAFWLYYLTTVSGVPPAIAGTIAAVGIAFEAISGPVFASWSDRFEHRLGKRRPFIIFSSVPIGFFCCLMFTNLPFGGPLRIVALFCLGAAFWILFAAFFIPHLAWGAEIATGYDERTAIRTYSYVMYTVGFLVGSALPTVAVDRLTGAGFSDASAWLCVTVILGVISVGSILFTGLSIREPSSLRASGAASAIKAASGAGGVGAANAVAGAAGATGASGASAATSAGAKSGEAAVTGASAASGAGAMTGASGAGAAGAATGAAGAGHMSAFSLKALVHDYRQVLRLRPLRLLIFAVFAYLIGNSMIVADRMYALTFQMGFSGSFISLILLVFGLLGIFLAAPMMTLANRFDKRTALILCMGICGFLMAAMRFFDIAGNMPLLLVLLLAYVVVSTAYWQLMPATFYDICEVDEYENKVKRAGTITSTLPMAQAIASAAGIQLLGLRLQLGGFESGAATQSPAAIAAIYDCFTLLPGALFVVGAFFMYRFPITKERFETIKQELAARRSGS